MPSLSRSTSVQSTAFLSFQLVSNCVPLRPSIVRELRDGVNYAMACSTSLFWYFCEIALTCRTSHILLIFCFWNTCEPTHIRFFLALRAALFSSSSNISVITAKCVLENEWSCMFDGNYRRPRITCCSGRWLNTTYGVNTDHAEGTKTERWPNGNVTQNVNRP